MPLAPLLDAVAASDRSPAALADALDRPIDAEALCAVARFANDRYVRLPMHRTEGFEVRLLCWLPGQSSALHGHGTSACAFRVLRGLATETLLGGGVRRIGVGQVVAADSGTVHQVANEGPEPLITLHVYSPPLPVDQPSGPDGRRIVILGGGFCGAAVAVRLLESRDPRLRVTIVERHGEVGRGVAYGTPDQDHLLNVPAGHMSIDPGHHDELVAFARARGHAHVLGG